MTVEEFEARLEKHGGYRLASEGVYSLRPDLTAQHDVVEGLRALGHPVFLVSGEDPADWDLEHCDPAGDDTWIVPEHVETADLVTGLLEAGNWKMYAAPAERPARSLPDLFKRGRGDAQSTDMTLVDAWHDGTEWRVLLPHPSDPSVR